jgi:uncharacterized UPF0160 family protein
MLPNDRPLVLTTHNGSFHADDCFAYAVLRRALNLGTEADGGHVLVRSRDKEVIRAADIVWDVGGIADEATWRFDHHQPGAPKARNDDPLSSAGLVWKMVTETGKTIGQRYVEAVLADGGYVEVLPATIDRITENIRYKYIRHVDLVDNGKLRALPSDITQLVDGFNSVWDDPLQDDQDAFEAHQKARFIQASLLVSTTLERIVDRERASAFARQHVTQAWEDCKEGKTGINPDVLELPRGMPWQGTAFDLALPILYVLNPEPNGTWKIQAMPTQKGSFDKRLPMTAAWGGLDETELEKLSGIPGAQFVHKDGFIAVAKHREAAMAMLAAFLANKPSPAAALLKAWKRQ